MDHIFNYLVKFVLIDVIKLILQKIHAIVDFSNTIHLFLAKKLKDSCFFFVLLRSNREFYVSY